MTICIGIGQCGVSCADSLISRLAQEEEVDCFYSTTSPSAMTAIGERQSLVGTGQLTPRAVLVDTEPKAISKCICPTRPWSYDPRSTHILGQSGAGNNWACGYTIQEETKMGIVDSVQREAERCDRVESLSIIQSAAGGTGSGLGAALTEDFRDAFRCSMANFVVCPFIVGEVVVQHYNSCLSLAHLVEISDAVCILENESLSLACTSALNISQPSFSDINNLISLYISSATLSSYEVQSSNPHKVGLSDSLTHLCSHPGYKFINAAMVPITSPMSVEFTTDSWLALSKRLHRTSTVSTRSLSDLLTLHGSGSLQAWHQPEVSSMWSFEQNYPKWNPTPFAVRTRERSFGGYEKAVTLLSNSNAIVQPIERLHATAYKMFLSRAYIHQYIKNGLEMDDFVSVFAKLEQVLSNYKKI
jgi:tubulin delta